jgi:signal transduction histidine kinase
MPYSIAGGGAGDVNPVIQFRKFASSAGIAAWALGAAAIAALALAVALIVETGTANRLEQTTRTTAAEARQTSLAAMALLQAVTDAETSQRGYLLTGQPQLLQSYQRARSVAADALSALARSGRVPDDEVKAVRDLSDQRLRLLKSNLEFARGGRADEWTARLEQGRQVMLELRRRLEQLSSAAQRRETAVRQEANRFDQEGRSLQIGLAVLTMLALLIAISSVTFERIASRRAVAVQERVNEALRLAQRAADEANAAKSRFLATASHDMRQPLHSLALYISSLDRRVDSPQAREILASMDSAVRSMTRLFGALLDMARLEAGALKPEPIDFPVGPLLEEVVAQSIDPTAREKARVRLAPCGLMVHSDPDLLEVILRNLTSNAVKHSKGEVLIGCRRIGGCVRIDVHDNGRGIPEDQIERLFAEFVRGEHAGSAEGIGLGLAIVERMAKLLGHPLTVRSESGRGSVFSILVPRVGGPSGTAPVEHPEAVSFDGLRILVADDEPLSLDAMKHVFQDLGAAVTTGRSGEDIRSLRSERFDLHVFDLNLGRDDGLRLLDELEAHRNGPVRAMIVTGATTPEVLAALRRSGRRWITKPISAKELAAAAWEVLGDDR